MTSGSLRRRALLGGTLAVTAVAGLAAPARSAPASAPPEDGRPEDVDALPQWRDGGPRPGVAGLLKLFTATPVVALSEGAHHLQDSWDFLTAVMFHPGFREVDAIVVELGNSRHQNVADDYVTGGIVRKSQLQKVWRDTTQSPSATGDVPVIFRIFGLARTINLFTSRRRPLRVLLADPPIDWSQIHNPDDYGRFLSQRDTNWATVITSEVLDKGQRCVTIGGGLHFFRNLPFLGFTPPGTPLPPDKPAVSGLIEQRHPGAVSVVHTHAIVAADKIAAVEQHVAGWARPSIAAARHTPYGRLPAADIVGDLPPDIAQRLAGLTVADLADHVLFLGPRRDLTAAVPDWEVFYEPDYWAELNHRKALTGFPGDLDQHRHETDPAMFPEDQ
jgi:hypothetical protein